MPYNSDNGAFLQSLQAFLTPGGQVLTNKALAPGLGQGNADSEHAAAIAFWTAILALAHPLHLCPAQQ